jgi:hypothetical protein
LSATAACGGQTDSDGSGETATPEAGNGAEVVAPADGGADTAAASPGSSDAQPDVGSGIEEQAAAPVADAAAEAAARAPCPQWEDESARACHWQFYGTTPPNPAWAAAASCGIPTSVQLIPDPNDVNVLVNCQLVPRRTADVEALRCWWFDNPYDPHSLVLSQSLCSELAEDGYDRIDVLYGCDPLSDGG